MRKRLLWVGDAGCESGFARATHETLETLRPKYDVSVLGLNYRGDPHTYPYPIYPAMPGGDWAGVGRLVYVCDIVKPDVIVLQNDPWNIPEYVKRLLVFSEYASIPVIGSIAVDALNCQGYNLNALRHVVFWTTFAQKEAMRGGFTGDSTVIPLGVDMQTFFPGDKQIARERIFPEKVRNAVGKDAYIVGCVGRNQVRKRLDLTIAYFAKWVKTYFVNDAWLYLHVGPTGDEGFQLNAIAQHYGVLDKLLVAEPPAWQGVPDGHLVETYRAFDLFFSTTLGEGMGLPALEAMACGVPCVLPSWSAYADWAREAAFLVPCSGQLVSCIDASTIGGVMDQTAAAQTLHRLYCDSALRDRLAVDGFRRVSESRYRWSMIGAKFLDVVDSVVGAEVTI